MYLVLRDLRHGEGQADAQLIADGLADGKQYQHERQLAGDDCDHLAAESDAGVGRAGRRAAHYSRNGGDEQQVEDDDDVRNIAEHCKRREAADGDEQLDDHQRREADYRGGEEGSLGSCGGDYRLLAAELEEIIERLKHRGADALLHPRDELAVDAAEQQPRDEAEQEAGEDKDIAEILEIIQNHIHNPTSLKCYLHEQRRKRQRHDRP